MEIGETLYVITREDFRTWLEQNHASKKEIWLVRYKKATRKPSLDYVQAVEEAICFGWVDSLEKSMDVERYALRFSPRRAKSSWTETNKERARRMITQGKMTAAGDATLPPGLKDGMPEKLKLNGGPEKTVTWIWLDNHGQLKVEYYDFSELAQKMFGNDIAYTLTVTEMVKLFSVTRQDQVSLIPWLAEHFHGYFDVRRWLEDNGIAFSVEIESWA